MTITKRLALTLAIVALLAAGGWMASPPVESQFFRTPGAWQSMTTIGNRRIWVGNIGGEINCGTSRNPLWVTIRRIR